MMLLIANAATFVTLNGAAGCSLPILGAQANGLTTSGFLPVA